MDKPPVYGLYQGVGTQIVVASWQGDRAYLASDHYPEPGKGWGYRVYRIPNEEHVVLRAIRVGDSQMLIVL